jgi:protein-S-isoprenylcysteine O-methyltransferase Ste14
MFGGRTPKETAIAWGLVLLQVGLMAGAIIGGAGSAWSAPDWLRSLCRIVQYVGLAILLVGAVNLGRSLTALPTPVPHGELRTGGLYRWMRHPIYTGVMALTLGGAVPSGNPIRLACALGLVVLFMLKARWEEARLREQYPGYADYAAGVPRFVPGAQLLSNTRSTDRP